MMAVSRDRDAIVTRPDIAIGHQHVAARREVDAIIIWHQKIAPDPNTGNDHSVAVGKMKGPEWGVCDQDVAHCDIPAVRKNNHLAF